MSVPVLLTVLDTNAASNAAATQAVDEHIENCITYVDNVNAAANDDDADDDAAAATSTMTTLIPNEYQIIDTELNDLNATNDDVKDKKIICQPILQKFHLHLEQELAKDEKVAIVGDNKLLGEWKLENAITLKPITNTEWSTNIQLPACQSIQYRYFIYANDEYERKHIIRWETQFHPRKIIPNAVGNDEQMDIFGRATENDTKHINRGWLTNETIIQFKFDYEQMFQVLDIERFDTENILIKIQPIEQESLDLNQTDNNNSPPSSGLNIETVKFNYGESQLQTQQPYGISYKRGDIIIFHITIPNPLTHTFAILFHTPDHHLIGKTIINAQQLQGSDGVLELEINAIDDDATTTLARLNLPYLIVRPFTNVNFDFWQTYAHYWPKSWPNLDIGHRGNGRSYIAEPPAERENTLASFQRSYDSHADMIELDVHLTSDGIPIIYHDFGIKTAPQGKLITKANQLEDVLIKDLTYDALKNIRVFAVINNEPIEYPSHNNETRQDHRIFPTLMQVFTELPRTLGIDVEIKWPQLEACGAMEAQQTIDKNFFIDRVLSIVIEYGCGRPLIFSSFDADICTMLRFKQNLFPIMFLTMGETNKWDKYKDLRTRSFEQAINNAQAFELAGTAPHAEDFLGSNGADMLQMAHNLGQIVVIWGDDCNSKERVKYFNEIGATATCYDRTDLYVPEGKERAFFNSTSLMDEFKGQCRWQNIN